MESHVYFAKSYLSHTKEEAYALRKIFEDPKWVAVIREKKFSIKELGSFTYRKINYWSGLGLIDDRRKSKGWRKFNFLDLTWLKILQTLRTFGFSTEKLETTKECLFDINGFLTPTACEALHHLSRVKRLPASEEKDDMVKIAEIFFKSIFPETASHDTPLPLFELYVIMACMGYRPVLLIYENGFCDIGLEPGSFKKGVERLPPHIRLELRDFVPVKFEKLVDSIQVSSSITLKTPEAELINAIRSGGLEEVRARVKNGEISLMEEISSVDTTNTNSISKSVF